MDRKRLARLLDGSDPAGGYEAWVRKASEVASTSDYLFADPVARFRPRPSDVVVALPGIRIEERAGVACLCLAEAEVELPVGGVDRSVLVRFLAALDGRRSLARAARRAQLGESELDRVLAAAFGAVLFAPEAVAELEHELSGVEITRFPGSPYEIDRAYWQNMVSVREHADVRLERAVHRCDAVFQLFRELHVIAVMGGDLATYYRPASRISRRGVRPGMLLDAGAETREQGEETIFVGGPRVSAALLGGARYQTLLAARAGDPGATADRLRHTDADGLEWGKVVLARSADEDRSRPWFCPPRPIESRHRDALADALRRAVSAADTGAVTDVVRWLARFHQAFIRLHPFRCANQSLAMNLVNLVLTRSHGAGIPHHVLDHLALRLSGPAYERVFGLAVEQYLLTEGGPLDRYRELGERKHDAYGFMDQVAEATSAAEAEELALQDPEGARAALVIVD